YTGRRSPFGRHAGALARLRPDDMLASVIAQVVADSGFAPEKIEDVVVGCANQAGEDSRCIARHAALVAGLPIEIPGSVLQRNCGSGLNAIAMAAQAVTCGEGDVFIAGGVESMSRAPFVMGKAEAPFSRDARVFDSTIGARFPNPKVETRYGADTMPETADNLAREYQITREQADVFAAGSQSKYAAAKADGFYSEEIIAVDVPGERAGLSLKDIDVIEINEAFASQVLACLRGLEVSFDDSRVNPNGGAIAIGHPLGASGPRIALTAARQLHRTGGRYALVAMCVGVGQGIAAVLERVSPKNPFPPPWERVAQAKPRAG